MTSKQLVKDEVSKYHLQREDLKDYLKALFPGARIKVIDSVSGFVLDSFAKI